MGTLKEGGKGPFLTSAQQSSTMLHFRGGPDSVRLKLRWAWLLNQVLVALSLIGRLAMLVSLE